MDVYICFTDLENESAKEKGSGYQQHAIVCALQQIGKFALLLNTAAQPLLLAGDSTVIGGENPAPLVKVFNKVLVHQSLAVRYVVSYNSQLIVNFMVHTIVGHLLLAHCIVLGLPCHQ